MFWNRKKPKDWTYYEARYRALGRELVPPMHEASTKQGELVRCIANLFDESERNGNANWDELNEEEIAYLLSNLPDAVVFESDTCRQIKADLDLIGKAGGSGHGPGEKSEDNFTADDIVFHRIIMRVVDWCDAHPELINLNPPDPTIRRFEKDETD